MDRTDLIERLNKTATQFGIEKDLFYVVKNGASMLLGLKKETKGQILIQIPDAVYAILCEAKLEEVIYTRLPLRSAIHCNGLYFTTGYDPERKYMKFSGYRTPTKIQQLIDRIESGREGDVYDLYQLKPYARLLEPEMRNRMYAMMQTYRGTATF